LPMARGHAFELAGVEKLPGGAAFARFVAGLLDDAEPADRIEMADRGRGVWRFATLVDGRLEACLFLAAGDRAALPPRQVLAPLLGAAVAEEARRGLLAARPQPAADAPARTVCVCFSVGLTTLQRMIASEQLTTVEAIGEALQAGTNCGSCVPELKEILRCVHAAPA